MSLSSQTPEIERSYGCSFGCGNPYDYIVISIADGSTEFLCLPCYVRLATDMVAAVINPDDPKVMEALRYVTADKAEVAPGPKGKSRGHNAPVDNDDPDMYAAYTDVVTVDDLPEEFK